MVITTRRQLERERKERAAARAILSTYLCPSGHTITDASVECPFGHRSQRPVRRRARAIAGPPDNLRAVPAGICVDFISRGVCENRCPTAGRCTRGFHPTVEDLNDLTAYYLRVNSSSQRPEPELIEIEDDDDDVMEIQEVPSTSQPDPSADSMEIINDDVTPEVTPSGGKPADIIEMIEIDQPEPEVIIPPPEPETCNLCYEEFSGVYALMEWCDHYFCPSCIKRWFARQRCQWLDTTCPYCREYNDRVLYWPSIIRNRDEKARMFEFLNPIELSEYEDEEDDDDDYM